MPDAAYLQGGFFACPIPFSEITVIFHKVRRVVRVRTPARLSAIVQRGAQTAGCLNNMPYAEEDREGRKG